MVDQPKKTKKTKFEMNPEVSDRETKAADIKMESTETSGKHYAIGMAVAKRMHNDEPPLEKATIKKAHKIAKAVAKEEIELDEANALGWSFKVTTKKHGPHEVTVSRSAAKSVEDAHQYIKNHPMYVKHKPSKIEYVKEEAEQIDEILSVVGRLAAARKMAKLGNSGILQRGKRKKSFMAMTMKRASGLGWKAARRQIKQKLAKGQDIGSLSAQAKARIEAIANKRKNIQKVIARKLTRGYLNKEDVNVNEAFNLMIEGKRYHQLMNKNGSVKFDMRFKHFREKTNPYFKTETNEELIEAVAEIYEVVSNVPTKQIKEAAALKALIMFVENDSSVDFNLHAQKVSRSFGVDVKKLKESYNELDS